MWTDWHYTPLCTAFSSVLWAVLKFSYFRHWSGVAYNQVIRQWSSLSVTFNFFTYLFVILEWNWMHAESIGLGRLCLSFYLLLVIMNFLLQTGSSRCQTQWVLWCQWRVILVRWWLWLVEIYVMWTGRQVCTSPSKHCWKFACLCIIPVDVKQGF